MEIQPTSAAAMVAMPVAEETKRNRKKKKRIDCAWVF